MNQTAISILQQVIQYGSELVYMHEKRKVEAVATLKALGLVSVTETTFQDLPRLKVTIKSPIVTI